MLLDSKKIILIVAVLLVLGFFVFYRKKNNTSAGSTATDNNAEKSSMANSILNSVTDAVKRVELSDEDEEYNLLRQEYADRYGKPAKESWSLAMIQQKIDEYEERSARLDDLVAVSGKESYEEAKDMNVDDIERLIEIDKQQKAKELEEAKALYKAAVGSNPDSSLDTVAKLQEASHKEYINAANEYQLFAGKSIPSGLTTALQVRSLIDNTKTNMRNAWNARKNEVIRDAQNAAQLQYDLYHNHQAIGDILGNVYYWYSNRDVVLWWFTYSSAGGTYESISALSGGKGYRVWYSNVKNSSDRARMRILSCVDGKPNSWNTGMIDEYGRCNGRLGTTLEETDFI